MKRIIVLGVLFFAPNVSAYLMDSTRKTDNKIKRHVARARALEDDSRYDALHKEFVSIQDTVIHFQPRNAQAKALRASIDDFSCVGVRCVELGYRKEAALMRDFCLQLLDCAYLVENRNLLHTTQFDEKYYYAVKASGESFGKLSALVGCRPVTLQRATVDLPAMLGALEHKWESMLQCDWMQAVKIFGEEKALLAHLAHAVRGFLLCASQASDTLNGTYSHIVQKAMFSDQ